mmetsp:Transcript_118131/g.220896  ORF Transcript_118131/g.220896 Transcript_118131/m.220896 type:complete len:210 (-) Transcript_118131:592-1221(-)
MQRRRRRRLSARHLHPSCQTDKVWEVAQQVPVRAVVDPHSRRIRRHHLRGSKCSCPAPASICALSLLSISTDAEQPSRISLCRYIERLGSCNFLMRVPRSPFALYPSSESNRALSLHVDISRNRVGHNILVPTLQQCRVCLIECRDRKQVQLYHNIDPAMSSCKVLLAPGAARTNDRLPKQSNSNPVWSAYALASKGEADVRTKASLSV